MQKIEKINIELQQENEELKLKLKILEAELKRYRVETFAIEKYRKLLNLYEEKIKELTSKIYHDEVFKN